MATRLDIAKPDILSYFDKAAERIFKRSDIAGVLSRERGFWRLAQNTNVQEFIHFLEERGKLRRLEFPFPYRTEIRYTWGNVDLLEILLTLKPESYFSHYTAIRMHGLTEQLPKTIYLNHEQRLRSTGSIASQRAIDIAFKSNPRTSNNVIDYGDVRVCLINGGNTQCLGVEEKSVTYDKVEPINVRVTNLERTLIDSAVRPVYAGGVAEVLKAFRLAREVVSVNRIAAYLHQLKYVYPYHQAIGFYLERAGVSANLLDILRALPMDFNFYLTHKMGEAEYIKEWRLFIPKGL